MNKPHHPCGEPLLRVARHFGCAIRAPAAGRPQSCSTTSISRLREGEIVGLLGRSGCGKSTLLRIVAGLMRPTRGRGRCIRARAVTRPAKGIAMVFQTFALFPWLTVLENVEAGPRGESASPSAKRQQRAR